MFHEEFHTPEIIKIIKNKEPSLEGFTVFECLHGARCVCRSADFKECSISWKIEQIYIYIYI